MQTRETYEQAFPSLSEANKNHKERAAHHQRNETSQSTTDNNNTETNITMTLDMLKTLIAGVAKLGNIALEEDQLDEIINTTVSKTGKKNKKKKSKANKTYAIADYQPSTCNAETGCPTTSRENNSPTTANTSKHTAQTPTIPSNIPNRDPRLNRAHPTQESLSSKTPPDLNSDDSLPDLHKNDDTITTNTTGPDQRVSNHQTSERHSKVQPVTTLALRRRETRSQVRLQESHHNSSGDHFEDSSEDDVEIENSQEDPSTATRNRKQHGHRR